MRTSQHFDYDLIVIGGGPGGYTAAAEAGRSGMKVLLVEAGELGGVCLNAGCIPTKTLLYSAKMYRHALDQDIAGVNIPAVSFSMEEAAAWKKKVVETYRKGVASLLSSAGVEIIKGQAAFQDRSRVNIQLFHADADVPEERQLSARNFFIAVGSKPVKPLVPGISLPHVVTSRELLDLQELPKKLVIIGGGVIGLEFAALYAQLGVSVDIVEMMPEILPGMDADIRQGLLRSFKALENVKLYTRARVTEITEKDVQFCTLTSDGDGSAAARGNDDSLPEAKGEAQRIPLEDGLVLAAVGRVPSIAGLGLDLAGVKTAHGAILVNDRMETSAPRIFALGDVIGKSLYAHAAAKMGEVAAAVLKGDRSREMDWHAIPWAVYTWPEAAGCGMTETEAEEAGIAYRILKAPMHVSARFYAENGKQAGLVKLLLRREDDRVLGVQILGAGCSEMIWGAAMAVQHGMTAAQISETIFPHPTVSEVIREAALK